MQAFYEVKSCNGVSGTTQTDGVVRNYYMAVEKVLWDYAPSGQDLINKINLTEANRWAKFRWANSTVMSYWTNTVKVNHLF